MTDSAQPTETPFVRPNDTMSRRFINRRILPPAPQNHVAFNFGKLAPKSPGKILLLGIGIELAHVAFSIGLIHLWRGFAIAPFTVFIGGMSWLAIDHPTLMVTIVLGLVVVLLGLIGATFAHNSGAELKKLKLAIRDWFRDERGRLRQRSANRQAVRAAGGNKSVRVPLKHKTRMVTQIVITREQWLRQGAENWTKKQRLKACFVSSLCVIPITLTSLSEFTAHTLLAVLYMKIYLRAYRRYGSQREAVLRTVHVHQAVNRGIILVLLLNAFIAYVNIDLFLSIHGH